MSDYYITGQCNDPDARLVVLNEADWVVEVDESPLPNYDSEFGSYLIDVTNSAKLVFVRKQTGEVEGFGAVIPSYIAPAVINLSESSFSPSEEEDGPNPANNTFDITNDGTRPLNWTVSKNEAWLSVGPGSGSTDPDPDSDEITVSYDITGLDAGDSPFTDTITVADAAASNSPQTIAVDLTITGGAPSSYTFLTHASDYDDPQGVILEVPGSQTDFTAQGLEYIYRGTVQSDGRVVIPCYDGNGPVVIKCYEAGSLTSESWSTSITGSSLYYFVDVAILNNGNLVFAWADYGDDNPNFAILSPEGTILQGMTDARGGSSSTYRADADYNVIITTLEDGGFLLTWKFYSYTETAASLWNANGTNREPAADFFGGDDEAVNAEPAQMLTDASPSYLSGQFPIFDTENGYGFWYNVTDLGEEWDYEGYDYYGDFTVCRVLPKWSTDAKMAVFISDGDILGTIVDDVGNFDFERKTLLSGSYILNSVIVLPNDTFLVQATSTSDYGLNYWIFDEDLDYVSGPTAAFTGITSDNLTNMNGGAV